MAMTVELPALERTDATTPQASPARLRRYARPALGLLLPVGLALFWEIWVGLGYSNGRLVPPPTKIFATVMELAKSGELSRHITATVTRVAAGFGLGGAESYPGVFGVFAGFADDARIENGFISLSDRPGIGFEGQAALYRIMRDLAA